MRSFFQRFGEVYFERVDGPRVTLHLVPLYGRAESARMAETPEFCLWAAQEAFADACYRAAISGGDVATVRVATPAADRLDRARRLFTGHDEEVARADLDAALLALRPTNPFDEDLPHAVYDALLAEGADLPPVVFEGERQKGFDALTETTLVVPVSDADAARYAALVDPEEAAFGYARLDLGLRFGYETSYDTEGRQLAVRVAVPAIAAQARELAALHTDAARPATLTVPPDVGAFSALAHDWIAEVGRIDWTAGSPRASSGNEGRLAFVAADAALVAHLDGASGVYA